MDLKSLDRLYKNYQICISNFIKISQVVVELFHPEGRKDRGTDRHDRKKSEVAVRNFTSKPKKTCVKFL